MQKSLPYKRLISAFPQAFADKIKESKEKIEKTAEKVKENIQEVKEKTIDSIQEVKEKAIDNIQDVKIKVLDNIQDVKDNFQEIKEKTLNSIHTRNTKDNHLITKKEINKNFKKKYKTNIKISSMKKDEKKQ